MARRGAGGLGRDDQPDRPRGSGEARRRSIPPQDRVDDTTGTGARRPPRRNVELPLVDDMRLRAAAAVGRGRDQPARPRKPLPDRPRPPVDPGEALARMLDETKAKRMHRRLASAARAYNSDRYDDARAELTPLVKDAPKLAEGRELMGLARYRLGQWKQAVEDLEAFRELSGSTEQHPVLADCHRALGHWADVDELWAELGRASPSAALVTEGRLVTAGAKADRGDLTGAIRMLEQGWKLPKHPRPHHLRRAYALADLYERGGRPPRARELFRWVADHAPDLADVRDRVRALS